MATRASRLLMVSLLLVLYCFTRLHNLRALPFFVDEGYHTRSAELVLDGDLVGPGIPYLGRVWYDAFLGPKPPVADWTARAGTVMVGMLGVSALYALARGFVSHRAGVIVILLWITTPYLLFYERMALSDPLMAPLCVVAAWVAWRMVKTGSWRWAIALSGMLGLIILVKASGIAWLPLPAAALIAAPRLSSRKRLRLGAISYGVFAAYWIPFLLLLKVRGFDYRYYLGKFPTHVGGLDADIVERIKHNIQIAWNVDITYLGPVVIGAAILGGLYWLVRSRHPALFTLLVLGIAAGGPIVFGLNLNSRYLLSHVPWVLLALACGAGLEVERSRRIGAPFLFAAILWVGSFFVPFMADAWNDPADLRLNENDQGEYIRNESAGFGTREIGDYLRSAEPLPVLGLVASCQPLRLAAYPVEVECPQIRWDGTSREENLILAEQRAAQGPIYVVGEDLPYIDLEGLPQPHTVIRSVERPGGRLSVILYRIEQGARRPAQ